MILVNQVAKDKDAIISKGLDYYDPNEQRSDIEFFKNRKRMTVDEAEYLLNKIEVQIAERDKTVLRRINN